MLALLATVALLQLAVAQAPPAPPPPPSPPALDPSRVADGGAAVLRGDWPAAPSGKRVTIDERSSVDDTIKAIGEAAGWDFALNTGRVGERMLVLGLKDVPVEEALRAALEGTGLAATRRGNLVTVAPSVGPVSARPVLAGFGKPSGKRFSGDFQDTDGRDALLQIGRSADLSIMVPQGALGKVTGHFKDVPVEEALKAVLAQTGLRAVRDGAVVTVSEAGEGPGGRYEFGGELGPALRKTVDEALRSAEREVRRTGRERGEAGASKDRERVGGDVVVEAGQEARDVHAVGGSVTLRSGAVAREVVAVGGSVTLEAGASARQAVAVGGDVRVGPGATVEKDAVSVGGHVQVDPSGEVGGQRVNVGIPGVTALLGRFFGHRSLEGLSAGWSLAAALARYAVYLALALLLLLLFRRRVEVVGAAVEANPVKSLLAGLLGLAAQPFLSILLIVTIIGIPLVLVQVLGVLLAGVFGFTAVAWWLGRRLPVELSRGAVVLQLALGLGIVFVATQIPVLGWLVWTAVVLVTFGAVLRTRFGQEPVLPTSPMPPYPPGAQPPPFQPPPFQPPPPPAPPQ